MRIYEEIQGFNQWWLYGIIILSEAVILIGILQVSSGSKPANGPWHVIGSLLVMILLLFPLFVKLRTRIDQFGISARFGGSFLQKNFKWNEISEVYVRRYRALAEYGGGWGIRGLGRAKAYSTSGRYGIQIVTTDNTRFLIGTQNPEQVKEVLDYYRERTNQMKKYI